jgi:hypothetical protein
MLTFSNISYSAICDCGALPECNTSRPPNCRDSVTTYELSSFFANHTIQAQAPKAFALNSESKRFISVAKIKAIQAGTKFIRELTMNKNLYLSVMNYEHQSIEEQIITLREVFKFEIKTLGIKSPKLVIDLNYKKAAYFEFNLTDESNGVVYINPKITYDENRMTSLSLLIHETRHAAQLQMAKLSPNSVEGSSYRQAFIAQKKNLKGLSFSDFLTLNNEYEAFLFANYIFYKLFIGKHEMIEMGTFASQFYQNGAIKIDLNELHNLEHDVLNTFNKLMIKQKEQLGI